MRSWCLVSFISDTGGICKLAVLAQCMFALTPTKRIWMCRRRRFIRRFIRLMILQHAREKLNCRLESWEGDYDETQS